jgi:Na+/H+ antiporter NhaC
MGILFPLAMPLTWAVMIAQGQADAEHMHILYSAVSAILAGAVWGDHCSPISDTTILSSLASGCDHIEHVRTQLPYALIVGGSAVLFGSIMTALGSPWWLGMSLGLLVLWLFLRFYGKLSYQDQASADRPLPQTV